MYMIYASYDLYVYIYRYLQYTEHTLCASILFCMIMTCTYVHTSPHLELVIGPNAKGSTVALLTLEIGMDKGSAGSTGPGINLPSCWQDLPCILYNEDIYIYIHTYII